MKLRGAVRMCYPDEGDLLNDIIAARSSSDAPIDEMAAGIGESIDRVIDALDVMGRDLDALRRLGSMLRTGDTIAMDYRGFYTRNPTFCEYGHDHRFDARPCMNMVLLMDGASLEPTGFIHLGYERMDPPDMVRSLNGNDFTLIMDRTPYTDDLANALDRADYDWLLVEPPFPISFSNTNPRMQPLTYDGKEYEACKARYDKRWLFRFRDLAEVGPMSERIGRMDVGERDRAFMLRSAGVTDALSDTGFDVRAVRTMLDSRFAMDCRISKLWRVMGRESKSLPTHESRFGYLVASMLGLRSDLDG